MNTVEHRTKQGFAIWITGLPSSGKSTLACALAKELAAHGVDSEVLESDTLRRILTPRAVYTEEERDIFYAAMVYVGKLLVEHGVPVIFDATANRREFRDRARQQIPQFLEVYVDCPLAVCMGRDPKGIYRKAQQGQTNTVPGLQARYEPPEMPDLVVQGDKEPPESAAARVVAILAERQFVSPV